MIEQLLIDTVAVILTLLVLSRMIGDNPLFRVAQYMFVGVSLGYAFVIVYHQVIKPAAAQILNIGNAPVLAILQIIPFLLGVLLLPRIMGRQKFSWLSNIPLGLIFGVSASLALSGALLGTMVPQILATINVPMQGNITELVGSLLLTLGVILSLSYFYFTVPRNAPLKRASQISARLGRWVIVVTFGFFFAGALLTYVTALSDRIEFIVGWVWSLMAWVQSLL